MAFAQLTYRKSLRDMEAYLHSMRGKLYHMGCRTLAPRSNLAEANENRDWRIFADFAQTLTAIQRPMHASDPLAIVLDQTLYALDSTTIDLCLALFPWARFRSGKAAVKVHTLLDLRGKIPTYIHVSDGKLSDVKVLDDIVPEAGAFYVMDCGYLDFDHLYRFTVEAAFFAIRNKRNVILRRRYSHPVVPGIGFVSDQTVVLDAIASIKTHPDVYEITGILQTYNALREAQLPGC